MSEPHPHPPADPNPAPGHELTPMESFFDNLFNQHMVLPQSPEPPPIQGVDDHGADPA